MISAQKVCSFMYVYSYLSFWGFWGLKKDLENWLEFSSFVYELTVSISDAMITAYSGVILWDYIIVPNHPEEEFGGKGLR